MYWWDLSELHRVKGFPDLRNTSLVHYTIYYIGIIYFVSSDIWLLSSGINRQLIVAGIHIYQCYSVLQCSCCCMWFLPFIWVSYSCFPTLLEWATPVFPLQDGWTALMLSCQNGHERVVEMLLNGGATVDMQAKVLLYWISRLNLLLSKPLDTPTD